MSVTELKLDLPLNMSTDEAKLLLAIKAYEVGKASLGQAARMAGYSKRAFIDILGHYQIPVLDYPAEDLRQEMEL